MSIHGHSDYTSADDLTKCTGNCDMDDPLPAGGSSSLFVNNAGSFEGDLQITGLVAAFTATCKTVDGQLTTRDVLKAVGVNIHMQGSLVGDFLMGKYAFTIPLGNSGGLEEYSFSAIR